MLPTSPTSFVRSSLEEMLENLRRRDAKPGDLPPALPSRPTSRGRLPSARRSLPVNLAIGEGSEEVKRKSDGASEKRSNSYAKKKDESDQNSPYSRSNSQEAAGPGSSGKAASVTSVVEWENNIGYFIKKKLFIWCRISSKQWESGIIQSSLEDEASVELVTGDVVMVSTKDLLPANPDTLDGVDDLIQLGYLNEPAVLCNLQHRYVNDLIYSKAGPILIAINPFKELHIYGSTFIRDHKEKLVDSPHVYAVADAAYNEMTKDGVNQSIIVSGESGAGKTETAKFAMQYLAALGGGGNGIEHEILQTSYILESFGNAKTCRNDNSSRFGKLIEIHFSASGKMCGAALQTFLLEKSRVVQLAMGERSYHVFYQLCAGAPHDLRERLNIKAAADYSYLNHSNCLTIGGVDDAQKYHKLMGAIDIIRINKEDQERMLSILAAILWLGNIKFQAIDNENHVEVVADEAVTYSAELMGCSVQDLVQVVSTRKIKAGRDSIVKKLTVEQATDSRDALAKYIYASLFDWLVDQINKSLAVGKWHTGRAISILDIYGFESFQKNSFEQLCINYANERLQQHFNRHLFKLEQEDYEADGIDWTKIEFEDNEECLNLFEKKPLGLLSLLDEESNFPKATDVTFADKLKQHLSSNPCFKGERDKKFSVRHYAGEVSYDTGGFLEKNRDRLPSESIHILLSSSCPLLQSFASNFLTPQSGMTGSQKRSVGIKFKGQLYQLMQRLESTTPHFIRCIKPNSKQLPGIYEKDLVAQQLKCCGVLEVVRIARAGYPSRITYQEFSQRYGFLLLDISGHPDPVSLSIAILQQSHIPPEMYQVGYTKLYFRTGQLGKLENMRIRHMLSAVAVQKFIRGLKARHQFLEAKETVTMFQSFIRGEISRRKYTSLSKQSKASTLTQKYKHKHSASRDEQQKAVVNLQSVIRGSLTRKQLNSIDLETVDADDNNPASRKSEVEVPPFVPKLHGQLVKEEATSWRKEDQSNTTQKYNQVPSSVLEDLKRRLEKAEASLEQKEKENTALKAQVQKYEKRWSDYQVKVRSMENIWKKQIGCLQVNLAATKRSLAPEKTSDDPGMPECSPARSPQDDDSEDNSSVADRTPSASTPNISPFNVIEEADRGREPIGASNSINHLAKEFEQRRRRFDEDARALIYSNQPDASPEDELRKLKLRFEIWKKEYKGRLRETKGMLQRLGNAEAERRSRKWWGKLSQKIP